MLLFYSSSIKRVIAYPCLYHTGYYPKQWPRNTFFGALLHYFGYLGSLGNSDDELAYDHGAGIIATAHTTLIAV